MSILSKLKAVLGIGGGSRDRKRGTRVSVEREPATETERAVKESSTEPPATEASDDHEEVTIPDVEPPETGEQEAPAEEPAGSDDPVDSLTGIGDAYAERLAAAGIETVAELAAADAGSLAESTDIARGRLEGWIEQARDR